MQHPVAILYYKLICTADKQGAVSTVNTLLDGSNVRLNWNIESDINVIWNKFKNFLSLY